MAPEAAVARTAPDLAAIRAAEARIRDAVHRTRLLGHPELDARAGRQVVLKLECEQETGSFKLRGATNFLRRLGEEERAAGVVAYSSGNHAQGVAEAARALGVPATIVMPADAPRVKIENTRARGATVQLYDRYREVREQVAAEVAARTGAVIVPPYDHPWTIEGQGTVALELLEQLDELGMDAAILAIPCGGGGLTAGCATVIGALAPATGVVAVEPAGFDDTGRSLAAGKRCANASGVTSICDALLAPEPGRITFPINRALGVSGVSVSDEETIAAMRFAVDVLGFMPEPGGAVALAALLHGHLPGDGPAVAIISGGNVDPERFADLTAR
jgi:threonine dehydratase